MNTRFGLRSIFSYAVILLFVLGCGSLGSVQPTNTPLSPGGGGGNGGSNSGGADSGNSNNNPNPKNPIPLPTLQETETPTITPTPEDSAGPNSVRQTMTAGKETLGTPPGGICVNRPWQVPVDTPQVSFQFLFGPYSNHPGSGGNTFGYAYNISSAGESHDASGTYTLSSNKDGSTKVTMRGRDHVVFKGFDGPIPVRYSFDLVPIVGNATCQ